jgi:hypothetical protein
MGVEGTYDCVTKTPLGDLASRFTVRPDGDRFTGVNEASLGSMEVIDGRIDGSRLRWTMRMPLSLPMDLECDAHIEGERLTGSVLAGGFAAMPMTGTRVAE